MKFKRVASVALPILIAIMSMAGIYSYASASNAVTPRAENGVLNLAEWNQKSAFEIAGEWEFYWNRALTDAQIESGAERFAIVEAPSEWNYYETELGELPGFGVATYRVRVTGARVERLQP